VDIEKNGDRLFRKPGLTLSCSAEVKESVQFLCNFRLLFPVSVIVADFYFKPNNCLQFLHYSSKDTHGTQLICSNFEDSLSPVTILVFYV
jgi:hypothetical protein